MDEQNKIGECWFCGSPRLTVEMAYSRCHYVNCKSCAAVGPEAETPFQAIAAWNKPALRNAHRDLDMVELQAEVQALLEANGNQRNTIDTLTVERDAARAEVGRLRAENELLFDKFGVRVDAMNRQATRITALEAEISSARAAYDAAERCWRAAEAEVARSKA